MQHSLNMDTSTYVDTTSPRAPQSYGGTEHRDCGTSQPLRDQYMPATFSQALRNFERPSNEISTVGGRPFSDEDGNSIVPVAEMADPTGYQKWDLESALPRDYWTTFEQYRDDPYESMVPSVSSPVVKPHLLASKSPETTSSPSGLFDPNGGGLNAPPSLSLAEAFQHSDLLSLGPRHPDHSQHAQNDSDQQTKPVHESVELSEPSASPNDVTSSRVDQGESQSLVEISPGTPEPADAPRDENPNPTERVAGLSTSPASPAVSGSMSETPAPHHIGRRRNASRRVKGIPTEKQKRDPAYQARPHACPYECGSRSNRSDNLWRHIQSIHIGKLVWECPISQCAKGCKRGDNGIQHLQMQHDSTCPTCKETFEDGRALYAHLTDQANRCP